MGASRRSSISRVNWNSAISGMATAWIPESTMLMAMMPGSSTFLYAPCIMPLVVSTRPKTKVSSSGCSRFCISMAEQVAAGHVPVARKHGVKRFPVQSRRLLPV